VSLTAAGGYTQSVELVTYVSGQPTTNTPSDAGTFSVSGSTITFISSAGGSPQTATVSGSSMSLGFQGATVIYTR
jgi:hypothetical protein